VKIHVSIHRQLSLTPDLPNVQNTTIQLQRMSRRRADEIKCSPSSNGQPCLSSTLRKGCLRHRWYLRRRHSIICGLLRERFLELSHGHNGYGRRELRGSIQIKNRSSAVLAGFFRYRNPQVTLLGAFHHVLDICSSTPLPPRSPVTPRLPAPAAPTQRRFP
jgi:hypothetical protein